MEKEVPKQVASSDAEDPGVGEILTSYSLADDHYAGHSST